MEATPKKGWPSEPLAGAPCFAAERTLNCIKTMKKKAHKNNTMGRQDTAQSLLLGYG